jgi:hypothetical protein
VQHEPRGLLRNAQISGKLATAYPLLVRAYQIRSGEPDCERDVACMEDSANGDAVFLMAFFVSALETLAIFDTVPLIAFAIWADRATAPTLLY